MCANPDGLNVRNLDACVADPGIESLRLGPDLGQDADRRAARARLSSSSATSPTRPAFTDHFVSEYRLQRLESSGVGAAARFRIAEPGLWMETVIDEVSPPHRIHESGAGGRWDRIPITTSWELLEPGPGGCEVTLRFWTGPSHPLDRLREKLGAERYYRRQWSIALSRLKRLIESGRPPARVVVAGADRLPVRR